MQTFVPYPDFAASAACLDNKRLGKQRVECLQILNTLTGRSTGWRNHPAVKLWAGHEQSLCVYALVICAEWTKRGYKDTVADKILVILDELPLSTEIRMPDWVGDEALHASHRSNLLRKDSAYYGQFEWSEPDDLPYVWR